MTWLRYPGQPWRRETWPYPMRDDDRLTLCGGVLDASQIERTPYARKAERCTACAKIVGTYNARMDTRYKLR